MEKQFKKDEISKEIRFYLLLSLLGAFIIISYFLGVPSYYMGWIAFAVAAFSVAGNDAIQTIGTFIESKKHVYWVPKILTFGLILVIVHLYGWYKDGGEIHFQRLNSFNEPKEFNLIQLLAPLLLVIITRLRAPISTTFLILGLFASETSGNINKMLTKSFVGYGIAFITAFVVWRVLAIIDKDEYTKDHEPDPNSERIWSVLQWISTVYLWGAWLLQDTANIAIFLPRKLNLIELAIALCILIIALGMIIKSNGGKIQDLVSEKSDIVWSKAGTIVDIVYATVLVIFQKWSNLPMSTTWVFLGILAGREITLHLVTKKDNPYLDTFKKVSKDILFASMGIIVSLSIFELAKIIYGK